MAETVSCIRVLLADDHPVVRQGLHSLLSNYEDIEVIGEVEQGSDVVACVRSLRPDVVLLDIRLPGVDGIAVTRQLRRENPDTKIIILTTYDDDEYLIGALSAGAHAYLIKSASRETLTASIRAVAAGERLLTPRLTSKVLRHFEQLAQVLTYMAEGWSNEAIAEQMYWSEVTVKRKVHDILARLAVSNRTQAVAKAIRTGLI
ncbi:MAG: response regulator transcription factor [Chloroflexi bacterium]|nr:response regulator transcription factor [Chloroflexota bacterium]